MAYRYWKDNRQYIAELMKSGDAIVVNEEVDWDLELGAIVREEARKAESVFSTYGVADVERTRELWVKNGGETITLPPAEAASYLKDVTSVIPAVLATNAQMKEDYDTLMAAAAKLR